MSDIMRPMSFEQLLNWTLTEYKKNKTVFGEHHPYYRKFIPPTSIFEICQYISQYIFCLYHHP